MLSALLLMWNSHIRVVLDPVRSGFGGRTAALPPPTVPRAASRESGYTRRPLTGLARLPPTHNPQWDSDMARKSRTAVLKRQREARKAEKQAAKREKRMERETVESDGSQVATADDLAGYGFVGDEEEEQGESEEPPGPGLPS